MENKFQVLVGLNEAGKSNILKALSFLDPAILPTEDDVRDPRHDENPVEDSEVSFIFGLEKEDTKQIFSKVKLLFQAKDFNQDVLMKSKQGFSLQEFCSYKKDGIYETNVITKSKRFTYYSLESVFSVSDNWKKVPAAWSGYEKFTSKTFKYISIADYLELKDDTTLEDIKVVDINNAVGQEIIAFVKSNLFECVVWRYDENNLLPARIDISTFKSDPDICEPLRNIFYLAGYNDIEKSLNDAELKSKGIKNLLRKISENTTSHLRKVWPEYKKISFELSQNGKFIEAGILDEFNVYSLDKRSDGFKRFVTFLLTISAKVKAEYLNDTLIIIDEPDIGLHPSGVQYLREELRKISKNNIVFVASHSIFMIDKDRIDTHLIIKKDEEETTLTSNYTSDMLDEEVIYRAMGYSLFEMLKKKNVIFEGWTDKRTFQIWLSSKQANAATKAKWKDVGLVHAIGAKDVQRVASNLENFDREYLVISDADQPSIERQSKFQGKYKWFTYKDLGFEDKDTIEDFLSEVFVNEAIMNVLKKEQLNNSFSITDGITFNAKLTEIKTAFKFNKDESERINKLIKNSIFESIKPDKINLEELIGKINEKFVPA